MHQIWYVSSTPHPEQARGPKIAKLIIQDGCHFEIYKNLNNSRTLRPILTKFGSELRLDTAQTPEMSNRHFSQSKMAANEKLKFTKK